MISECAFFVRDDHQAWLPPRTAATRPLRRHIRQFHVPSPGRERCNAKATTLGVTFAQGSRQSDRGNPGSITDRMTTDRNPVRALTLGERNRYSFILREWSLRRARHRVFRLR